MDTYICPYLIYDYIAGTNAVTQSGNGPDKAGNVVPMLPYCIEIAVVSSAEPAEPSAANMKTRNSL
jgi:hypothetical protein